MPIMAYIKSVVAGVVLAIIALVGSTISWMIYATIQMRRQFPNGEIGFDLRSMLGFPSLVWLFTFAGFCAGFYWQYRKAT
jgi:hypothetical protein